MKRSAALSEKNAEWYAKHYYLVEEEVLIFFERLDAKILDKLITKDMKILDAMMGRGRGALRYAKLGAHVTGNDLNPHMVELVAQQARREKLTIRLTNLDVTNLSEFADGEFDLAFAMYSSLGTIPNRQDRENAMRELARVVRKNGLVVIHAHNRLDSWFDSHFYDGWKNRVYFPGKDLERGDIVHSYNGLKSMYNHLYAPAELKREFTRAGLKVTMQHYVSKTDIITGLLKKFKAEGFVFVGRKL